MFIWFVRVCCFCFSGNLPSSRVPLIRSFDGSFGGVPIGAISHLDPTWGSSPGIPPKVDQPTGGLPSKREMEDPLHPTHPTPPHTSGKGCQAAVEVLIPPLEARGLASCGEKLGARRERQGPLRHTSAT